MSEITEALVNTTFSFQRHSIALKHVLAAVQRLHEEQPHLAAQYSLLGSMAQLSKTTAAFKEDMAALAARVCLQAESGEEVVDAGR